MAVEKICVPVQSVTKVPRYPILTMLRCLPYPDLVLKHCFSLAKLPVSLSVIASEMLLPQGRLFLQHDFKTDGSVHANVDATASQVAQCTFLRAEHKEMFQVCKSITSDPGRQQLNRNPVQSPCLAGNLSAQLLQ